MTADKNPQRKAPIPMILNDQRSLAPPVPPVAAMEMPRMQHVPAVGPPYESPRMPPYYMRYGAGQYPYLQAPGPQYLAHGDPNLAYGDPNLAYGDPNLYRAPYAGMHVMPQHMAPVPPSYMAYLPPQRMPQVADSRPHAPPPPNPYFGPAPLPVQAPVPGYPPKPRRFRRRHYQIHRKYSCCFQGCTKSYGSLNHLNTHIVTKNHGLRKSKHDFKHVDAASPAHAGHASSDELRVEDGAGLIRPYSGTPPACVLPIGPGHVTPPRNAVASASPQPWVSSWQQPGLSLPALRLLSPSAVRLPLIPSMISKPR
ncbi:hypothetical protein METBIDRAFT_97418 [Metschnikowia bicuspidata var. bicuspidata NRRL YB-4993]|uniref:C2H2-type domain-containing protein n=1 Tax=Metschnikowia bicuspidata var. bicuspidata NRRL YB-4993 TaxID=869754 RepID=A0A1A0HGC4_9ASCO|nr:hypothetical protein METBIDRAFT_97418 [Metschnikowia bicuspidata var. bicuspidata NRRL YB-4993]OBA23056.1 hypothetical protein METBIDRAFT_97418 [Metschnikowia bicuspidata var. bicuspidata NRRL YB-4993]